METPANSPLAKNSKTLRRRPYTLCYNVDAEVWEPMTPTFMPQPEARKQLFFGRKQVLPMKRKVADVIDLTKDD